jgi:ubiquinone/menaquinone biosynthesis C-methylase UbiE
MIDQIFDQIAPRFDRANALASQTEKFEKENGITNKYL